MSKKIVIVGGVAGGMSAATRLRRLMDDAEITVYEKGPYVSFANCGLPYYVSGEISEYDSLVVQTPEKLKARFDLNIQPNSEVLSIDPESKTIQVKQGEETITDSYDDLILSPGAKPFIPPIENLEEAKNVFSLRNIPDLDAIMDALEKQEVKDAVVVGAGFIGLEMAENLHNRGLNVTIVEKAPHVLPPLDEEMAAFVRQELEENDVKLITSQSAVAFEDAGKAVTLEDGTTLNTDLTILSVGVQPENTLAKDAGIELGLRGGIKVNERYQTSEPNIYAVGDAIIVKQQITGEDTMISLASPANRQGRQVADVIAGLDRTNKGSIGTAIVRVFNLTAASTGLSERQAKIAGLDYAVVHSSGSDHASYYPGATTVRLKLIFNRKTGEIYGAQGVGQKGIDKRIDVLATAIKGGLTVFDLPELEFTYAPPFGSAKDPVNMVGYEAMNIIEGISETTQWYDLEEEVANGAVVLDVRNEDELANGQFKDSTWIPLHELRERMEELDKNTKYIATCASGVRSYIAERMLKQAGYNVKNLDGAFGIYSVVKPEEIVHV
jgi:NADPH-dependent 2,4-dienoyl-CoA reductase/sulfur reductase-like enzyme/rhodanese-related sulfurtransferase